ncbi:hypothetical protein FNV43_RR01627 [Rhamnella rubrinervis]|uniref:Uncharacterized protein n=1 Tax=Rhamnella rubrinervis TaxID=2594499 RepID=A0A8K0HQS1_9ROSA|nr:hypothetical protein FNV43_RR01627 [Rhamnella rubrinervis]
MQAPHDSGPRAYVPMCANSAAVTKSRRCAAVSLALHGHGVAKESQGDKPRCHILASPLPPSTHTDGRKPLTLLGAHGKLPLLPGLWHADAAGWAHCMPDKRAGAHGRPRCALHGMPPTRACSPCARPRPAGGGWHARRRPRWRGCHSWHATHGRRGLLVGCHGIPLKHQIC